MNFQHLRHLFLVYSGYFLAMLGLAALWLAAAGVGTSTATFRYVGF